MPLMLAFFGSARADTPLAILHLDPAVSIADDELGVSGTAKLEFPIAWFVMHTAPAMVGALGGRRSLDDVLAPAPPISPQYLMYVGRPFGPDEPIAWGGGVGLRFRPLAGAHTLVPPARGLWIDIDGRYGTPGWGVDGGVGWDVPLGHVVEIGPSVTGVWEGGGARLVAGVTVSLVLDADNIGGETTISTP